MSIEEKLLKLLEHWIKHNNDHAETYQDWADRARQNQLEDAAGLIEEAAEINLKVNSKFEQALELIRARNVRK